MTVHACRQTENPRHPGFCACGKRLNLPSRNLEYERSFLKHVVSEADRRFGVSAESFVESVARRLNIGAERYGDNDFLSKDVIRELLEETPDVAAYCLLQAQKILQDMTEDDDRAWHLFEASVHAAAADHHARMARIAQ